LGNLGLTAGVCPISIFKYQAPHHCHYWFTFVAGLYDSCTSAAAEECCGLGGSSSHARVPPTATCSQPQGISSEHQAGGVGGLEASFFQPLHPSEQPHSRQHSPPTNTSQHQQHASSTSFSLYNEPSTLFTPDRSFIYSPEHGQQQQQTQQQLSADSSACTPPSAAATVCLEDSSNTAEGPITSPSPGCNQSYASQASSPAGGRASQPPRCARLVHDRLLLVPCATSRHHFFLLTFGNMSITCLNVCIYLWDYTH